MKLIKNLANQLAELVFPPACLACEVALPSYCVQHLCQSCEQHVEYLRPPVCKVCGSAVAGTPDRKFRCGRCHSSPPVYKLARSFVYYQDPIRQLITKLKYKQDTSVLPALANIATNCDLGEFKDCELILPVPLHLHRLRQRGFNQSLELAKCFFPHRIVDIKPNLLMKQVNTSVQAGLDGAARRKNLRDSFALKDRRLLLGKKVCLVDDVFTTGSTVGECARVLAAGGCAEVRVLTLARAGGPQCGSSQFR